MGARGAAVSARDSRETRGLVLSPQDVDLLRKGIREQIAQRLAALAVLDGTDLGAVATVPRRSRDKLREALIANPCASHRDLARAVYGDDSAKNRNRLRSLMRSSVNTATAALMRGVLR